MRIPVDCLFNSKVLGHILLCELSSCYLKNSGLIMQANIWYSEKATCLWEMNVFAFIKKLHVSFQCKNVQLQSNLWPFNTMSILCFCQTCHNMRWYMTWFNYIWLENLERRMDGWMAIYGVVSWINISLLMSRKTEFGKNIWQKPPLGNKSAVMYLQ